MINILYVEASEMRGGIESFIINIVSGLDRNKYNVFVLTCGKKASIEKELETLGGNIIHISPVSKGIIKYIKEFNNIIDSGNFQIVHINKNSLANPVPIVLCKINKIKKVILHSHNTHPTTGKISVVMHNIFKILLNNNDLIKLACSEKAGNWLFKDKKNVILLHNGIDVEKYKFDYFKRINKRKELGISENQKAICSVGRLNIQKNPIFILDIFKEFLLIAPDSCLYMIGSGELIDDVKKHIHKLGIYDNVRLLGNRNDINELLQAMDLFLMPSLYEGLPIAAIEAQAAGLPVLISDTVDTGVKICDTTEFESLSNSSKMWASHVLRMIENTERIDTSEILRSAGYDINNSVKILDELYTN